MPTDDLLTVAQAAARLGRAPSHVRNLIRTGRLPAVRWDGRTVMLRTADVDRLELPGKGWRRAKKGEKP